MAAPDLSALQADAVRIKTEGLSVIKSAIDGLFGVGEQEVASVAGDVEQFIVNFISAKLSGPAASFLAMVLGVSGPAIASGVQNATAAIAAELQALNHQVDGLLGAIG